MKPSVKDQLIHNIVKLEELINNPRNLNGIESCFYNILSPLFSNDGYRPILNPRSNKNNLGIDFLCTRKGSGDKFGISFIIPITTF